MARAVPDVNDKASIFIVVRQFIGGQDLSFIRLDHHAFNIAFKINRPFIDQYKFLRLGLVTWFAHGQCAALPATSSCCRFLVIWVFAHGSLKVRIKSWPRPSPPRPAQASPQC
ncbi:MAG: hypothetical protein ACK56I_08450, partial [bacterium]